MKVTHQFDLIQAVRDVLKTQVVPVMGSGSKHHFGRPFMTAYQIAIKVRRLHPSFKPQLPLGGAGTGPGDTLARVVAHDLSVAIANGNANDIEGAFLSNAYELKLVYQDEAGNNICSSLTDSDRGVSIFRLKN